MVRTEMKISARKPYGFYCRSAVKLLTGDESGVPADELIVSALGVAIPTAVSVAAYLSKEANLASIEKVECSYLEMGARSSHCPQIVIEVHRRLIPFQAPEEAESDSHRLLREISEASEASRLRDSAETIAGILCGSLKYRSGAKHEILDHFIIQQMEPQSPKERFKFNVEKVMRLAGQRLVEESRITETDHDHHILLLKEQHWLECTDPKHRYGSNLRRYFQKWVESDTLQSFFAWLDEGAGKDLDLSECPRKHLEEGHVKYLTNFERESYRVTPKDGKLYFVLSGEVVHGDKIFVMAAKGELYMGTKIPQRFHHSSFLGGAAVTVAGSAALTNGNFTRITPHSGHYRPTPGDFEFFVKKLKDDGLSTENVNFLEQEIQDEHFGDKRFGK